MLNSTDPKPGRAKRQHADSARGGSPVACTPRWRLGPRPAAPRCSVGGACAQRRTRVLGQNATVLWADAAATTQQMLGSARLVVLFAFAHTAAGQQGKCSRTGHDCAVPRICLWSHRLVPVLSHRTMSGDRNVVSLISHQHAHSFMCNRPRVWPHSPRL